MTATEPQVTTQMVVCVCCPCGCEIAVQTDSAGQVTDISGYECARGRAHAQDEVTTPARVLTLCLCVAGAMEPLSVKTAAPIPKALMARARDQIMAATPGIALPVAIGDVIVADVCATGIPAIATKPLG